MISFGHHISRSGWLQHLPARLHSNALMTNVQAPMIRQGVTLDLGLCPEEMAPCGSPGRGSVAANVGRRNGFAGRQGFVDETRSWIRKNSGGGGAIRLNSCESSYKPIPAPANVDAASG